MVDTSSLIVTMTAMVVMLTLPVAFANLLDDVSDLEGIDKRSIMSPSCQRCYHRANDWVNCIQCFSGHHTVPYYSAGKRSNEPDTLPDDYDLPTEYDKRSLFDSNRDWAKRTFFDDNRDWAKRGFWDTNRDWAKRAFWDTNQNWAKRSLWDTNRDWSKRSLWDTNRDWSKRSLWDTNTDWSKRSLWDTNRDWSKRSLWDTNRDWSKRSLWDTNRDWSKRSSTEYSQAASKRGFMSCRCCMMFKEAKCCNSCPFISASDRSHTYVAKRMPEYSDPEPDLDLDLCECCASDNFDFGCCMQCAMDK